MTVNQMINELQKLSSKYGDVEIGVIESGASDEYAVNPLNANTITAEVIEDSLCLMFEYIPVTEEPLHECKRCEDKVVDISKEGYCEVCQDEVYR